MDVPDYLKYSESHEWIDGRGDGTATIGITAFAVEQLGELVELPKLGTRCRRGEACAVVESTKAASDVYAPLAGEVIAVNGALADAPALVNSDPYKRGWLFKLNLDQPAELAALLDVSSYRASANAR